MLRYSVPAPWLGNNHHCENIKKKAPATADAFFFLVYRSILEAELNAQTEVDEVACYSGKYIETRTVVE